VNLLFVSGLLITCIIKFLGYRCVGGANDWSCVIAWRSFAGTVLRAVPLLLALSIFGARRTRILSIASILAIAIDVIAVDMMA
jgi:hypothetical protein